MKYEILDIKTDSFEMECLKFGSGEKHLVIIPGVSLKPVIKTSAEAICNGYSKLAEKYTVMLFDRKKNITEGYLSEDMAEDTVRAIKELGVERASFLGCSQGGMIALVIAERYPELVDKLIVSSTLARQNGMSRQTFSEWIALCKKGNAEEVVRSMQEKVYSFDYREKFREGMDREQKQAEKKDLERFRILCEACLAFDAFSELKRIKCPMLAIGAEGDRTLSVIGTNEIAREIGCEKYIYTDHGHAVYDEAPDFLSRMSAFLG